MLGDLTSLAAVQAWLGVQAGGASSSTAVLDRLISQCSRAALDEIGRPSLLYRQIEELRNGTGGPVLVLRDYPVEEVVSLEINGTSLQPSVGGSPGYVLEPYEGFPPGRHQSLTLVGAAFTRGQANVRVVYRAGYRVAGEQVTIGTDGRATALQPLGPWAGGLEVTNAGTPMTLVAANPAAGQYAMVPGSVGVYQFPIAMAGQTVALSYSYTPGPVESAVIEWVAERFRYRDRIGQRSKTVGNNETASYDNSPIPGFVKKALQPYRKRLPI